MYTMFILHKFYLFIYLMSVDILVPSLSQNLCLQIVARCESFDKHTIMLEVRILIQGKYDLYLLWC